MVGTDRPPARVIDGGQHRLTHHKRTRRHRTRMHKQVAHPALCRRDRDRQAVDARNRPRIADLPAALAIKRRLVQDDSNGRTRPDVFHRRPVHHQRCDLCLRRFGRVAQELGGTELLMQVEPDPLRRRVPCAGPCRAGAAALLVHCRLEPGRFHGAPLLPHCILREVEGKAERVIKLERNGTR